MRAFEGHEDLGARNAMQALMALASVEENIGGVRRKHLNAAKEIFFGGGSDSHAVVDFASFRNVGVGPYAIGVSTSRDLLFREQMEKNLNEVAGKVRAYLGAYVEEKRNDNQQLFVEYEEGKMKHLALIQERHAYVAEWKYDDRDDDRVGPNATLTRPLQITKLSFSRSTPDLDADMLLEPGISARDDVAAALRAVAVQDVLKAVGGRPNDTSIREAVREWGQAYSPGYNGWGKFMYRQDSKWFDMNSASAIYPNEFPNEFREQLEDVRGEVRGSDLVAFGAYPVGYKAAEILPELRKIAVKARELVGYDASDGKGNDICTAWGYGCGGIDDVDALAVGEGDDICAPDDCGGITEVVGGSFGGRIRASIAAYIRRVDAAIAADSSLSADEIKKLHGEISGILVAFRSHVGGSLMQTRGGLQMLDYQAGQQNKGSLSLAESFRTLSEFASGIEILKGKVDALKPEESHIAARKIRYSVIHKDYDGQLITILRMKENNKASVYVAWVQGGSVHYCP
jgi:hypothetical protein